MRKRPFLPRFQRYARDTPASDDPVTNRLLAQARALATGKQQLPAAASGVLTEMKRGTIKFTVTGVAPRVCKFAAGEILDFAGYIGVYDEDAEMLMISEECFKTISATPATTLNSVLSQNVDVGPALSDTDSEDDAARSSRDNAFEIEYHDRYSVAIDNIEISTDGGSLTIRLRRVPSILTTNSEPRELHVAFPPVSAASQKKQAAAEQPAAEKQLELPVYEQRPPVQRYKSSSAHSASMAPRVLDTVQKSESLPWVVVSEDRDLGATLGAELRSPIVVVGREIPVCLNRVVSVRHLKLDTGEDVSISDGNVHTSVREAELGLEMNVLPHANQTASSIDMIIHNLPKFAAVAKHIAAIIMNQ